MKTRKRTLILCLLLANVLILGCSLGSTGGSTPEPTTIPGWEKFAGGGIELWMPDSFEGGDLANDLDVILARLRSYGSQYQQMADMIEQNSAAIILLVYDTSIGPSGFLTNVNVVKEKVLSKIDLETYMKASADQITSYGFQVLEKKVVKLDAYEAGRMVLQADALQAKELMYIIKKDNTMWVITYATGISEYSSVRATFEQSANTIRIP